MLLGLAFHPNFANNKAFYINYIDMGQATVIARYTYYALAPLATVNSQVVLLTWQQVSEHLDDHVQGKWWYTW